MPLTVCWKGLGTIRVMLSDIHLSKRFAWKLDGLHGRLLAREMESKWVTIYISSRVADGEAGIEQGKVTGCDMWALAKVEIFTDTSMKYTTLLLLVECGTAVQ